MLKISKNAHNAVYNYKTNGNNDIHNLYQIIYK